MQEGIFDRLPFADYLALPALSNSTLAILRRSPSAFQYALDNPSPPTEQQMVGTAVHTMVLEPWTFDDDFAVLPPDVNLRTKEGRAYRDELINRGRRVLRPQEFEAVREMVRSVLDNPTARKILDESLAVEQTLVWRDEHGIWRKCRKDITTPQAVIDLKTTRNLAGFDLEVRKHHYHCQAAWYLDGERQIGPTNGREWYFIAVQTDPPYESEVFQLHEDYVDCGRAENDRLISIYRQHLELDDWSRSPAGVTLLQPPAWLVEKAFPEHALVFDD